MKKDTYKSLSTLKVGSQEYQIFRLDAVEKSGLPVSRLPYSLKILLENLLRLEDDSVEA
jgi:aconitate hydratase